jgi:hypothetical protein
MEDLVKRTEIVDAELVRAVGKLFPGESLERILDETRNITLKRVLSVVKSRHFSTVIHLVEHLKASHLTPEDAMTILKWISQDATFPETLRTHATSLLDSGLFDSVFEFVSEIEEVPVPSSICCFPRRRRAE